MKLVPLAKIAQIIMGQSPPSSTYNTDGEGLPFFQGKADFGDLYPTVRMFCTEPKKIAEAGDILISVRAPVGPTNISPERSCIGRGLAAIRSSQDIDRDYLLYFLRSHEPELAQHGRGSTFGAISRNDLESILVPFCPLPEQKRIAAILAKADRLRRLRRCARDLSGTYLQSVFLEMFGDYIYAREFRKLGEVITSGPSNGLYKPGRFLGSGVLFFDIKGLYSGFTADFGYSRRIQVTEKELAQYGLLAGDILINRVSKKTEGVGKAVLVEEVPEPAVYESNMMRLRIDEERISPWFLIYYLASETSRRELMSKANISNQASINQGTVKSLRLILPPLPLQQKFAHIVHKFERLRAQQREAERQAEHLFQTLLHRAFRGDLTGLSEAASRPKADPSHGISMDKVSS